MNQYWKAAAPEPVYGQRQCRVGRVLGDQRSDTPDQSAARSTTLGHLLSKGVTKGKGGSRKTAQQTKERREVRAVLEILDQSTARKTRHNTRGKRRARRGQGEGGENRQPKDRTETNRGGKGAGAKDTEKRGRTTHRRAQKDQNEEGTKQVRVKVITPKAKISE
jgi:hypothetical protein